MIWQSGNVRLSSDDRAGDCFRESASHLYSEGYQNYKCANLRTCGKIFWLEIIPLSCNYEHLTITYLEVL